MFLCITRNTCIGSDTASHLPHSRTRYKVYNEWKTNSVQGSHLSLNWGKPTTSSFASRHLESHRQLQSRQPIYGSRYGDLSNIKYEGCWGKRSRPSLHNILQLFWREWGKQRNTSACPRSREFNLALPEWKIEVFTTQQRMFHAVGPAVSTAVNSVRTWMSAFRFSWLRLFTFCCSGLRNCVTCVL